jgi:hypothetical protein
VLEIEMIFNIGVTSRPAVPKLQMALALGYLVAAFPMEEES